MTLSFMHCGNDSMASYRYRVEMPAHWLNASINNPRAGVHVYAKPVPLDIGHVTRAKAEGKAVIADICDLHFDQAHYREIVGLADLVTCSTRWISEYLRDDFGIMAMVIPESWEREESPPHCHGNRILWFGHASNHDSLQRIRGHLGDAPLTVVSSIAGETPWSPEALTQALAEADIVILPETAPYKSANRAVEAIRAGCFVVAEPHPALDGFPVYTGNLRAGIEWAANNQREANGRVLEAQAYIRARFSPRILENAWRTAIRMAQSSSISAQAGIAGTDGPTSISTRAPMSSAT